MADFLLLVVSFFAFFIFEKSGLTVVLSVPVIDAAMAQLKALKTGANQINSSEMYLAIPAKTTKSQREAIQKAIDYAKSHRTEIIVKEIK